MHPPDRQVPSLGPGSAPVHTQPREAGWRHEQGGLFQQDRSLAVVLRRDQVQSKRCQAVPVKCSSFPLQDTTPQDLASSSHLTSLHPSSLTWMVLSSPAASRSQGPSPPYWNRPLPPSQLPLSCLDGAVKPCRLMQHARLLPHNTLHLRPLSLPPIPLPFPPHLDGAVKPCRLMQAGDVQGSLEAFGCTHLAHRR